MPSIFQNINPGMMENTNSTDMILWIITAMVLGLIVAVLTKGYLKGQYWEKEMKLKRRQIHSTRYH